MCIVPGSGLLRDQLGKQKCHLSPCSQMTNCSPSSFFPKRPGPLVWQAWLQDEKWCGWSTALFYLLRRFCGYDYERLHSLLFFPPVSRIWEWKWRRRQQLQRQFNFSNGDGHETWERQHSHSAVRRESRRDADIFLCLFQYALIPHNFLLPPVCITGGHESTRKKIPTVEIPQEEWFYQL